MRLQVDEVRQRLREKRIDLQLTDRALEHALEEAFDPAFGARPLKRYLEKHIVSDLSVMLLNGSPPPTAQRILASAPARHGVLLRKTCAVSAILEEALHYVHCWFDHLVACRLYVIA